MTLPPPYSLRRLWADDVPLMRQLNAVFVDAFGEPEAYAARPPSDAYLARLLAKEHVVVLTSLKSGRVIGGLVAYELDKLEQARTEVYIYDLAVAEPHRRRGVATALIEQLRTIAAARGAWVVFVQADPRDDPAVALYERLGVREEVLHFDIPVAGA